MLICIFICILKSDALAKSEFMDASASDKVYKY